MKMNEKPQKINIYGEFINESTGKNIQKIVSRFE